MRERERERVSERERECVCLCVFYALGLTKQGGKNWFPEAYRGDCSLLRMVGVNWSIRFIGTTLKLWSLCIVKIGTMTVTFVVSIRIKAASVQFALMPLKIKNPSTSLAMDKIKKEESIWLIKLVWQRLLEVNHSEVGVPKATPVMTLVSNFMGIFFFE